MSAVEPEIKRVGIPKRLRFDVFKRDGFRCQYCGATPDKALLQCDHVHPVALGGQNDIDNLVTACQPCNLGKGARPLDVKPESLETRALETAEREEQIAMFQAIMRARRERIEDDAQEVLSVLCDYYHRESISRTDFGSIKMFIEKIGLDEVLDSVDRAFAKLPHTYGSAFKYFCGVCWGKYRDGGGQ